MDYKTLTDKQLEEERTAILIEKERRDNLAQIPDMIQELSAKYKEGGGNQDDLLKAVNDSE